MTTPSPPKTTSTTNKPTVSTPKTYTDHALILRTQNLGEADRIIIMLTRNNGITHAVAKSIRKPNSKFGARLEPYMHVALSLTQGRGTLRTITQTTTLHAYTAPIMGDYTAYTTAAVIAETCETLTTNTPPEETPPHYTLTHGALAALAHKKHHPHHILARYLTQAMQLAGWPLTTNTCIHCGTPTPPSYHTPHGTLCPTCAHTTTTPLTPLNTQETTYLNALTTGHWDTIDKTPTHTTQKILNLILNTTQYHLETPLKTLTHLETKTP